MFVPPGTGAAAQKAPLRIRVAGMPQDVAQHLAAELDGIDVTALAALEGSDIVITPAQPLEFGKHTLRLMEYTPDGGIAERGRWTFELRQSAAFLRSQLQANVTATATQDVGHHNVTSTAGPLAGSGSAQVQAAVQNESWQATGTANLVANSQTASMPLHGSHLDLASYLLTLQSGHATASVGDQPVLGPASLVLQGSTRGVTVGYSGDSGHVTGFSMSANPLTGSANASGTNDDRNRIDGMVATLFPLAGRPDALALSGTYVDGESTGMTGAGVSGSPQPYGGHASSVVADAQLFDQLLRLRGEAARSSYDFDGVGIGLPALPGHAYSGLANYTPWHSLNVLGQPLVWNIGAQKELRSTYFQSPATPGTVSDRDMGQVFSGLDWYGLNAQAAAAEEHDNVDDNPLVPRTRTVQHSFSLGWTPVQTGAQTSMPWYGTPNLSASYITQDKSVIDNAGSSTLAVGPLHWTSNLMLGAQFQHATWSWGANHTRVRDKDYAGFSPETDTIQDVLRTNFLVNKLSVGASVEHDRTKDLTNLTRTQQAIGSAQLTYPFSDKVSGTLSYNVNHSWADVPASDLVITATTLNLTWSVIAATGEHAGLQLGLNGSRNACRDKLANSGTLGTPCQTSYQMFATMTVSWMPSF